MLNFKIVRLISLLLSVIMLGICFFSCDTKNDPIDTTDTTDTPDMTDMQQGDTIADIDETVPSETTIHSEKTEESTTVEDLVNIPTNNYGSDFYLWIMPDSNRPRYHWVEESENDVLSSAIYTRQQRVYDYLGVNIIGVSVANHNEYASRFKNAVKNKEGNVDMMLTHVYASIPSLISENYLFDFSNLSEINLNAEYWNLEFMEDLSLNGHYYLGFSDFNILYTHVITFNKDMMDKYADSLEKSVYDMVLDKEWTYDQMIALANLVYIDQTSNGKTSDDTFGITGQQWNEFPGFFQAAGIKIVEQDIDGEYKSALMNDKNKDKTIALVEKLSDLVLSDCSYFEYGKMTGSSVPLTSGRTLMHLSSSLQLDGYLNYDITFGVLPYPLWDTQQDNYHHLQWGGYIAVPTYLNNEQMASETMEMLSFYSNDVKIAYYEKMLGRQIADVPEDSKMLSIIWDTVCTEFSQTYGIGSTSVLYLMADLTREDSASKPASTIAGLERSINTAISKFMKRIGSD